MITIEKKTVLVKRNKKNILRLTHRVPVGGGSAFGGNFLEIFLSVF